MLSTFSVIQWACNSTGKSLPSSGWVNTPLRWGVAYTRLQTPQSSPFFFGPLHTTASSLLCRRNPIDMTANLFSLSAYTGTHLHTDDDKRLTYYIILSCGVHVCVHAHPHAIGLRCTELTEGFHEAEYTLRSMVHNRIHEAHNCILDIINIMKCTKWRWTFKAEASSPHQRYYSSCVSPFFKWWNQVSTTLEVNTHTFSLHIHYKCWHMHACTSSCLPSLHM